MAFHPDARDECAPVILAPVLTQTPRPVVRPAVVQRRAARVEVPVEELIVHAIKLSAWSDNRPGPPARLMPRRAIRVRQHTVAGERICPARPGTLLLGAGLNSTPGLIGMIVFVICSHLLHVSYTRSQPPARQERQGEPHEDKDKDRRPRLGGTPRVGERCFGGACRV